MSKLRTTPLVSCLLAFTAALGHTACSSGPGVEVSIEARTDATKAYPQISHVAKGTSPLGELVALDLSPKLLVPSFSPKIRDYAIRCEAGFNPVTIAAQATKGGVRLVEPAARTMLDGPVARDLVDNQAVVIESASGEYWVRCLPHDFPKLVASELPGLRGDGYYVVGSAQVASDAPYVMLLDEHGTPIWYQRGTVGTPFGRVESYGPGTLTFASASGLFDKDSPGFATLTVDSNVVSYTSAISQAAGHATDPSSFVRLPNHHQFLLTHERVFVPAGAPASDAHAVSDCLIQELDAQNGLVWEWRASEHVDLSESVATDFVDAYGEPLEDPYGCSGLDVAPGGDVLLTARNLDAVLVIEQGKGKVRLKLGGTPPSDPDTIPLVVHTDEAFGAPADARFLPNGHITLFDGRGALSGPVRGVEYELEPAAKQATLVKALVGPTGEALRGGFRVTSDGNRIASWGKVDGAQVLEVDGDGTPAFTLQFGDGSLPTVVTKVPSWYYDRGVLRRSVVLQ